MSYTQARAVKIIVFLALFVLIDWGIEWADLRPRSITATVDSIALASGVSSQVIDNVFVGVAAYLLLQIVLVLARSLRFLTGEPPRAARVTDQLTQEHGAADE